jgi:hypothetical protein
VEQLAPVSLALPLVAAYLVREKAGAAADLPYSEEEDFHHYYPITVPVSGAANHLH